MCNRNEKGAANLAAPRVVKILLFRLVAFFLFTKAFRFLFEFTGILPKLLGIIEDLLLSGSEKRADLFTRVIHYRANFRPLFFSNRLDPGLARLHNLFDLLLLLARQIQQAIEFFNAVTAVHSPVTSVAAKFLTRTTELIASTEIAWLSRRRRFLGELRFLRGRT